MAWLYPRDHQGVPAGAWLRRGRLDDGIQYHGVRTIRRRRSWCNTLKCRHFQDCGGGPLRRWDNRGCYRHDGREGICNRWRAFRLRSVVGRRDEKRRRKDRPLVPLITHAQGDSCGKHNCHNAGQPEQANPRLLHGFLAGPSRQKARRFKLHASLASDSMGIFDTCFPYYILAQGRRTTGTLAQAFVCGTKQ